MRRRAIGLLACLAMGCSGPAGGGRPASGAPGGRCETALGVVVVVAGLPSGQAVDFGRLVEEAFSRYGCYRAIDAVAALEGDRAQGTARLAEAAREAEAGRAAFDEMRLDAALGPFERAVAAYTAAYADLPYAGPLVDALLHLGTCQAAAGRTDDAIRSFWGALRLRPGARVDEVSALPEAVDAFGKAAAQLDRTGTLLLDADPANVEVWLEDRYLGASPISELTVPAGPHWVVLRRAGWERKAVFVDVPVYGAGVLRADLGRLAPAARKAAYDAVLERLQKTGPMGEDPEAMSAVRGLFGTQAASVVRAGRETGVWSGRLAFWDLGRVELVWSGVEPEVKPGQGLHRGDAESLVSQAIGEDEARRRP